MISRKHKKYYIFYLYNGIIEEYEVYAYTTDKAMKDLFLEYRDPNVLIYKKEYLSKIEERYLIEDHQSALIREYTHKVLDRNKGSIIKINIPMTEAEHRIVMNQIDAFFTVYIYKYCWLDPDILSPKMRQALLPFGYQLIHDQLENNMTFYNSKLRIDECLNVYTDFLGIFVSNYGYTLRNK